MTRSVLVTGGSGFIGAHLVKRLLKDGWRVGVLDSLIRGDLSRLSNVMPLIKLHQVDIRDEEKVAAACIGYDLVIHLAAINGTENFYSHPELVLDVGIRGAISIVNACRKAGVMDLVVASSAEVYQSAQVIPSPESIALTLPDTLNPRYSYGGSKIATELIAFNYAREHFRKVQVFRPHNIYGPAMGQKHVIPQLIAKAIEIGYKSDNSILPIQGSGKETRAFCYVDDAVEGVLKMYKFGNTREVFHIGNDCEVSIIELVDLIGEIMCTRLLPYATSKAPGGTDRRCPDISKMRQLGYQPSVDLKDGLRKTIEWYLNNSDTNQENSLL
jgi:UDP-glucose 4-epimerase